MFREGCHPDILSVSEHFFFLLGGLVQYEITEFGSRSSCIFSSYSTIVDKLQLFNFTIGHVEFRRDIIY